MIRLPPRSTRLTHSFPTRRFSEFLRSHDRVLSDRVERAWPGVRRLARGARAAGSRYVSRGYAPDIPRTSKAVGDVAPTYELTLSGSIDICLRQIVQMHPLRIAQERGQQHHHLHDAVADRGVLVLVAAHGGVVEPEGRQDQQDRKSTRLNSSH